MRKKFTTTLNFLLFFVAFFSVIKSNAQTASFTVNTVNQCFATNNYVFTNTSTAGAVSYHWDFGDGTTSTLASPTHVYASAGYHYVNLQATYSNGVTYTATGVSTYAGASPNPSFSSSQVTGLTYGFSNTSSISTGYVASYVWDFGDGGSASGNYVTHAFASAGTYNVKLVVANEIGCTDSITTAVVVSTSGSGGGGGGGGGSTLTPSFTINNASQCLTGNSFAFTNTSTNAPLGTVYNWNFGDGSSSALENPTHSYVSAGYYSVSMTATYGGTTYSTGSQSIYVGAVPVANFSSSFVSSLNYGFNSTSTVATGYINSYSWDFGDGGTATTSYAQHTYAAVGTYNVKLVVITETGCADSITTSVSVSTTSGGGSGGGSGSTLTPSFSINSTSQCLTGNSFVFTNTSTNAPIGTVYSWNFGDGSTSSATNPTHSYSSAGYYYVSMTATYGGSTYSSGGQTIYCGAVPVASFSSAFVSSLLYSFNSSSTVSTGYINSYSWDFGDGGTATTNYAQHTYASAGTYTVSLTVTTETGCTNTYTASVIISTTSGGSGSGSSITPAFTLNATSQCVTGNSFVFTNTTVSAPVGTVYNWNFGDGDSANTTNATHSYTSAGYYYVVLTATYGGQTYYSGGQSIYVGALPTASFTSSYINPLEYGFNSTSTVSTGYINSYSWDFGDGGTATTNYAQHTYATLSIYNVKLVVTTETGCADSITTAVIIDTTNGGGSGGSGVSLNPSFTVSSSSSQCITGNSFTFTNTTASAPIGTTYNWNFGDGTTSSSTSPTHTYTSAGYYYVTLTATYNGQTFTASGQTVTVVALPQVSIATYSNGGLTYTFNSTSTTGMGDYFTSYTWSFGDGGIDSIPNPQHSFATAGVYTVTLTVTTSVGCTAATSISVTTCPTVTASFSLSSLNNQCQTGNSYTFINSSTNNASVPTSGMSYVWYFGDGATYTGVTPPAHTYASWGDYDVKLVATLTVGTCTVSDSMLLIKAVSVAPMPVASYRLILDNVPYMPTALLSDTTKRCWRPGYDFSYQSSSTLAKGTMDYFWHFGTSALYFRDGDSSHYINPRIVFDTAGTYPVKLVVVSDKGCMDSVTRIVELSDPHARFNYSIDSTTDIYASPTVSVSEFSYDYGGYLVAWNWNFGGGVASSSLQNPSSFSYACGGNHSIVLQVTSDVGCVDDTSVNIVIRIRPKAMFSTSAPNYTPNIYARPTYTFTNNTTVNDACPNMSYAWDFGDGYTSSSTNPTHIYKGSGTYTVTLIATNNNGGKRDTTTGTVTVLIRPRAIFSMSQTLTPNVYAAPTVSYSNTSSSQDTAAPAASLTYAWDFGDGSTSNLRFPSTHQYASGGTYTVTLIVTNAISGLSDTISHNITVAVKPQAAFTTGSAVYSPNVYAQPDYTFTNGSTVNDASGILSYAWSFGDGGTSTATNPNHTYTSGGTYTVTLIVTNSNGGLKDTTTATVVAKIKPQADFTSNVNFGGDVYANPTVNFANSTTSSDGAASLTYAWDFGDGNTSSSTNPNHQYANGGTYTVTLIATNTNGGLKDTIAHNVTITIKPHSAFTSVLDYGGDVYSNPTVNFTNGTSSTDGAGAYTYAWDFGDGATSVVTNPNHTYSVGGTYTVTLISTNTNGGAKDTIAHNVNIIIKPKAIISVHSDTVSVAVPMPIGNADYKRYTVTALSNAASPSTIVSGSIAHTEITIDTVYIPRSDSSLYAVVNDADAIFGIQLDTLVNYRFNVRLIVTSDLGVKDTAYAILGSTETGISYYRTRNPNSPITTLPNIGAKEIVIPAIASDKLFVYPNPTQNVLRIDARNCTSISVYNVAGVKVLQRKVSTDNEMLQVQQLPNGTYFIIATMKDGTKKNQKFIKE